MEERTGEGKTRRAAVEMRTGHRWPSIGLAGLVLFGALVGGQEAWLGWQRREGFRALQRGDWMAAEDVFRRVLALRSRDASALMGLGEVALRRGDLHRAERLLREAYALNPNVPHLRCRLANVLYRNYAPLEAERLWEEELRRAPQCYLAHLLKGLNAFHMGRCPVAISELEPLAQEASPSPELLKTLGKAYLENGQTREALRCFDRARQQVPQDAEVHYLRGLALAELARRPEEWEEALRSLQRSHHLDPRQASTEFEMGKVCERLGRPLEARKHYERALELYPYHDQACYNLYRLLKRMGEEKEAERWKERFQELAQREAERRRIFQRFAREPYNPEHRLAFAEFYARQGLWEKAETQLRYALRLAPDDPRVRRWVAQFYQRWAKGMQRPP